MALNANRDRLFLPAIALAFAIPVLGCDCKGKHLRPNEGNGTPVSIDFQSEQVGLVKTMGNQVIFTNNGSGILTITGSQIAGANPKDFSLTSVLPATVPAGETVVAALQFMPSTAGARLADLQITTDSLETPTLTVSLKGLGVQVLVCAQPPTLDFGNVQINGTAVTLTSVITNCGGSPADMVFAGFMIEGNSAADFSMTGQANQTLQPGQSLTLSVTYAPTNLGASTADIPFVACNGCTAQQITLTGVGVDGAVTLSPSPVNFGQVQDGQSATMQVIATNSGTADVSINAITTQAGSVDFQITPPATLPATLTVGQTMNLTVTFAPVLGAPTSDQLLVAWTVVDPAVPARTATDQLSGNAQLRPCTLLVTPPSMSFGSVQTGKTVTKLVTLNNTGETACSVSGISLVAGSDPGFAIPSGTTAVTVQPASPVTVGVAFTAPAATSPLVRKGTLTFQTGDLNNPTANVGLTASISNSVYSAGWPKWHQNNANTGQTEADTSWLTGTVAWKFQVDTASTYSHINSPVVDSSGNIYQVAMSGTFYALSPSGTQLWTAALSTPTGDPHPSTPAILANGSMYVASGSDGSPPNLYLIASSGGILSQINYGEDGFDASPGLGNDGTLYLADDDSSAGSAADPYTAVTFTTSGTSITQSAGIYLPYSLQSERFGVVIADDGSSFWGNSGQFFGVTPPAAGFKQMPSWPAAGVTVATATYSVVSDLALDARVNNHLYAYAAWESYGTIYTVQGVMAALNPSNGSQIWSVNLPATALPTGWIPRTSDAGNAAPAVADDGTVYVGNGDGLYAIDGATGAVKWTFLSANVCSSPAIGGDGTVFFGASDGNLYAVHPDGTLRFKVTTGGAVSSSPAIAQDGTLYATSDDGYLYAVK